MSEFRTASKFKTEICEKKSRISLYTVFSHKTCGYLFIFYPMEETGFHTEQSIKWSLKTFLDKQQCEVNDLKMSKTCIKTRSATILILILFTQENIVRQACKTLGQKMKGNCSVTITIHDKRLIAEVTIDGEGNVMDSKHMKALL